jgi:hypothetical protein
MTETTTDAATQDPGVEPSTQPEEQPAEAVSTADSEPDQPQQSNDDTAGDSEPGADPDNPADPTDADEPTFTPEWLQSKGIDPNDPQAFEKVANMAFNSEKAMSRSKQQASALEKQVNQQPATTDSDRVARLELGFSAAQWRESKGIPKGSQEDLAMGGYLEQNPLKLTMLREGLLTFDEVYSMSGAGKVDPAALKRQGGEEALRSLNSKQRASSVSGSSTVATNTRSSGTSLEDIEERLADVKF